MQPEPVTLEPVAPPAGNAEPTQLELAVRAVPDTPARRQWLLPAATAFFTLATISGAAVLLVDAEKRKDSQAAAKAPADVKKDEPAELNEVELVKAVKEAFRKIDYPSGNDIARAKAEEKEAKLQQSLDGKKVKCKVEILGINKDGTCSVHIRGTVKDSDWIYLWPDTRGFDVSTKLDLATIATGEKATLTGTIVKVNGDHLSQKVIIKGIVTIP